MKTKIFTYITKRCLSFLNKDSIIRIETTPFSSKAVRELLESKGFVLKHNDWYHNGFVFVKILNDVIEIKTIDCKNTSIYISCTEFSISDYIKYLTKIN